MQDIYEFVLHPLSMHLVAQAAKGKRQGLVPLRYAMLSESLPSLNQLDHTTTRRRSVRKRVCRWSGTC